jgi:hypothetical protein
MTVKVKGARYMGGGMKGAVHIAHSRGFASEGFGTKVANTAVWVCARSDRHKAKVGADAAILKIKTPGMDNIVTIITSIGTSLRILAGGAAAAGAIAVTAVLKIGTGGEGYAKSTSSATDLGSRAIERLEAEDAKVAVRRAYTRGGSAGVAESARRSARTHRSCGILRLGKVNLAGEILRRR